ncbi:MAG: hypothetical protein GF416_03170 [Candidatus Altiarchaeales archaeon]|nr:hypothetical protein [Candidatus Altiarchaeales archaeon]MBD3416121.1 hypothetical protein [Candidatus Altiarchaeales archaeon]
MKNRNLILLVPVLFIVLGVLLAENSSAEIVIVNETKPSFYALEDMTVSGDLNENMLTLEGTGEVIAGEDVKVYILGRPEDVLVDNMRVNGRPVTVSFDKEGYYMILEEGEFTFRGDLTIRTRGQVRLYVPGPVNEMTFDIENGYAIKGDQYGLKEREVIVQRSDKVAMLVDGSFKYSYAERDQFSYRLDYRSFGSSLGQATLTLRNGESIVSVVGATDYSISGSVLTMELEGETANVAISGTFDSRNLRIPLDEGRHHVLIESDPQKKITISTGAEEIDLSQSSISPSYSNARAFLASPKDAFSITVDKLEMFPSLAASVSRAVNRIAITEKGSMLAELTYKYSNTGMDYIGIEAPGTPLYAATGYRSSVKLTKDDDKLFLSFPKTEHGTLDMIYFESREPLKFIDMIDVPVANTDLTITEATTQILLPKDYIVLWTYGAKGGSELPSLESVLIFTIVFFGLGYMMKSSFKYALLYLVFSVGLFYFSWVLLILSIIASMVWVIRRYVSQQSVKWMLAGAAVLVVICLFVVAFFGVLSMGIFSMGGSSAGYESRAVVYDADYAMVDEAEAPMVMQKSMSVLGAGEGALNVPVREGVLPVRLELPYMGKTISVTSHLVHKDEPLEISVLVVAAWLKYVLYVISLMAGMMCVKSLVKHNKKGG